MSLCVYAPACITDIILYTVVSNRAKVKSTQMCVISATDNNQKELGSNFFMVNISTLTISGTFHNMWCISI